MGWLVALIAIILFVWLLVTFPGLRIAVVLVVVGLATILFYSIHTDSVREAQSHSLISPSQLDFNGVTLRQDYGWKVAGTVKNNSAHTLTGLRLKITVRDCPENSSCIVIGEDNDVSISLITVPPSQLRTFEGYVTLNNMPTPKKPVWNYQVVQTTAAAE